VLFLWWHDTSVGSIGSLGERLTAIGRITGLLGTYLLLVLILLMGRIAWLDWFVGMDRLAIWHRRLGREAIALLVAHGFFTIWGYGTTEHSPVLGEAGRVVLCYPDVLAATIGLALLVVVGITSARVARRKLKYETWYFVHLYSYLAVALAFVHQLATGSDFALHPVNRAIWCSMYALVAGLLVWNRLCVPIRNALRHQLRVAAVVREAPGVVSVIIGGRRLDEMQVEAGQFFLWRFMTDQRWWQAHPFSLSAAPDGRSLRITVKSVGDFSANVAKLRPGIRVIAEGPYGAFTWHRRARRKVLLIGIGIGIAPVRALLEALPTDRGELTVLYRASGPEDLAFRGEIESLAHLRNATVHYILGSRSDRFDPLGPERLTETVPGLNLHDVYVCGPPSVTDAVLNALRKAGVPRRHIYAEGFGY
jgi:predicted ferric reductase